MEVDDVNVELGKACNLDNWMDLVENVKDSFPGLETREALEEHRRTVLEFMGRDAAVCAKIDGRIVGTLLFSRADHMLGFLAVDEAYRRQHIAGNMVAYMLSLMEPGKDVVVTTYRAGVLEGVAARAFYKRLGFVEGRLAEEFGSPVQEFVLKR